MTASGHEGALVTRGSRDEVRLAAYAVGTRQTPGQSLVQDVLVHSGASAAERIRVVATLIPVAHRDRALVSLHGPGALSPAVLVEPLPGSGKPSGFCGRHGACLA